MPLRPEALMFTREQRSHSNRPDAADVASGPPGLVCAGTRRTVGGPDRREGVITAASHRAGSRQARGSSQEPDFVNGEDGTTSMRRVPSPG